MDQMRARTGSQVVPVDESDGSYEDFDPVHDDHQAAPTTRWAADEGIAGACCLALTAASRTTHMQVEVLETNFYHHDIRCHHGRPDARPLAAGQLFSARCGGSLTKAPTTALCKHILFATEVSCRVPLESASRICIRRSLGLVLDLRRCAVAHSNHLGPLFIAGGRVTGRFMAA
jgi:hypothetical protein